VRGPCIGKWKGTIEPESRCDEPVISVDLFPTFVALGGGKVDPKLQLDGESLVPLLKSSGKAKLKRDALYWHFPGYLQATVKNGNWRTTPVGSIRKGDWKLIEFFEDGTVELYNLKEDIGQKNNLAKKMPEKARELLEQLRQWRKEIDAPMPMPVGAKNRRE